MTKTTSKTTIIAVQIFRLSGEWCYAADDADGFDHSDTIDVLDGASEADARAEMARQFPGASITKVADIDGAPPYA